MIPILIAGAALLGLGAHACASMDNDEARKINTEANDIIAVASKLAQDSKRECQNSINSLAEEKTKILQGNMRRFVDSFSKIKPVNFKDTGDLYDISGFNRNEITTIQSMVSSVREVSINDVVGGVAGTALAIGAADIIAGGSILGGTGISIGGLAGGAAVSAIAAPIFAITGIFSASEASANLEKANSNMSRAIAYQDECETYSYFASALSERCDLFCKTLNNVDVVWFSDAVRQMELLVNSKKTLKNFFKNIFGKKIYNRQEMQMVASTAALAKMVKTIIDTNILDKNGKLADEAEDVVQTIQDQLNSGAVTIYTYRQLLNDSNVNTDLLINDFNITCDGTTSNLYLESIGENDYAFFVKKDDFRTARGLSFPASISDVIELYGIRQPKEYLKDQDIIYKIGKENNAPEISRLKKATRYIYYNTRIRGRRTNVYSTPIEDQKSSISFYFDDDDQLLLVGYLTGDWSR